MAKVIIDAKLLARSAMTRAERGLWAVGEQFKGDVRKAIGGARHGRYYPVPATKRMYQASAPGEAPANRTGNLKSRVASLLKRDDDGSIVFVGANVPYAPYLEEGTSGLRSGLGGVEAIGVAITEASAGFSGGGEFGHSGMAPRPVWRPTLLTNWPQYMQRYAKATGMQVRNG